MRRGISYFASAVHGREGVRVHSVAHGKLVGDLKERRDAEDLGQVGADAGEHEVVEEDIPVDLLRQIFDGAGV